jgi:hypothetical protein
MSFKRSVHAYDVQSGLDDVYAVQRASVNWRVGKDPLAKRFRERPSVQEIREFEG